GSIRLGLRYVSGLREEVGKQIAGACGNNTRLKPGTQSPATSYQPLATSHQPLATSHQICPKCSCDDPSMLENDNGRWFCNNCSHDWTAIRKRFTSLDDLVARSGLRRDELVTLADIGALNSFGYDRRSALWQAEHAVRPAGELF